MQENKEETSAGQLDVSVVIPVHNALPYFEKCLRQLESQTIPKERMEVIIVDNGSTDGSGDVADTFAERNPNFRVFHQQNSGGPAGPRNRGIEEARGTYVLFHDADDYLGKEALARMVDHAKKWNSDILIPRYVRNTEPDVIASMFKVNIPRADVYTSTVARTLGTWKMYRRAFLIDTGLRFNESCFGEDTPFTLEAMLRSNVISTAGEYGYYNLITRDDGNNLTARNTSLIQSDYRNPTAFFTSISLMCEIVLRYADLEKAKKIILPKVFNFCADILARLLRLDIPIDQMDSMLADIKAALAKIWTTDIPLDFISLPRYFHISCFVESDGTVEDIREAIAHPFLAEDRFSFHNNDGRIFLQYESDHTDFKYSLDLTDCARLYDYSIERTDWTADYLQIEGAFYSPFDRNPDLVFELRPNGKVEGAIEAQVAVVSDVAHHSRGGGVPRIQSRFSARIDFDVLTDKICDGDSAQTIRWDFVIGIRNSSIHMRVGSRRVSGMFPAFINGAAFHDRQFFIAHETTGYSNFSLIQASERCDFTAQPFVQQKRRYLNNRIVLDLLRHNEIETASRLIESTFSPTGQMVFEYERDVPVYSFYDASLQRHSTKLMVRSDIKGWLGGKNDTESQEPCLAGKLSAPMKDKVLFAKLLALTECQDESEQRDLFWSADAVVYVNEEDESAWYCRVGTVPAGFGNRRKLGKAELYLDICEGGLVHRIALQDMDGNAVHADVLMERA